MNPTTLLPGNPVPWFSVRSIGNPAFRFHTLAGRYVVLSFFGSAGEPGSRRVLDDLIKARSIFDDENFCCFGVSIDPADEAQQRVQDIVPGIRFFWDFDRAVSRLFGAAGEPAAAGEPEQFQRFTLVLDERLRVLAKFMFSAPIEQHVPRLLEYLASLPRFEPPRPGGVPAPVLVVPRIFEPEFCDELIRYYDSRGGEESGFMQEVGGKTVYASDPQRKRRKDATIEDETLRTGCMARLRERLVPEIQKAFQYKATRIERYIVACYDADSQGHFLAHRDNTTKGTAHRRFAVSLNLNTGDYDGGLLWFPEFGRQLYQPPRGGAVVFSCSLLHEATPVLRGRRYAFLPFLYDEEAAKIRDENAKYVEKLPGPGGQ